jgi:hypothetical protein
MLRITPKHQSFTSVRVTSSFCVMPKHNHQDQEPTPIGCLIFKELANQPLGFFAALHKQRRGELYRRFLLRQCFLKTSSKNILRTAKNNLTL